MKYLYSQRLLPVDKDKGINRHIIELRSEAHPDFLEVGVEAFDKIITQDKVKELIKFWNMDILKVLGNQLREEDKKMVYSK